MRIYVAGAYSAPDDEGRLDNTMAAMRAGHAILQLGHTPFIPHLSHFFDIYCEAEFGSRLPYITYLAWDIVWLRQCDALLYLGSSPGAVQERGIAEQMGIPVYTSVEQIEPAYVAFSERLAS